MPIFRVGGTDAAGERFERRRFEAADEAALRTMLAGHSVSVESARRVGLTRWPLVRHGWPILVWPLLAFVLLGACVRLVVTGLVLLAAYTEYPLYEQLAREGQAGEAEVKTVRSDKQDRPFEWAYAFETGDGRGVTGVLQRGFGSIRERRFDVSLAGAEPAVGQRFPVTFLGGTPEVHVPGRMDAGSIGKLDAAVRTVLWQGVMALGVALGSIWGIRNILLRLGAHYWLDDDGTVIEYAGRRPVKLRLDLERDAEPDPEDTG
jgi:hypothetical protein